MPPRLVSRGAELIDFGPIFHKGAFRAKGPEIWLGRPGGVPIAMSIRVVRLSFSLPPLQRWISPTRCYIEDILRSILIDGDEADRLAIAVHELLENAVKYCIGDQLRFEFEVNRDGDAATANMRTTNSARTYHAADLSRKMDAIIAAADPVAHFDEAIRDSLVQGGTSLGLARIRAELGVQLSYQIQKDVVVVFAEMPVRLGEEP